MTTPAPLIIGIPIYDGVDLLDVAAPVELFGWFGELWNGRDVSVYVLGETCDAVTTRAGLPIVPQRTFDDVPHVDLLWVPGGDPPKLKCMMQDDAFLDRLRAWSENATYVTSVCEGALLLDAAGLLDGFKATTHWAFIPCLAANAKITVLGPDEDYPRFVIDPPNPPPNARGVRITGAGISSGLDEALAIIALIAGTRVAESVQKMTQYLPKPPVSATLDRATSCILDSISADCD